MQNQIKYSFLLAFRSRYALVFSGLAIALIGVALLAASFSARQPQTVTLDLGLSFIRLALPLIALLLLQDLLVKDIENKTIYMYLAYPQARASYLLGRLVGIAVLLLSLLILLATLLALLTIYAGSTYEQSRPVILGLPYLITQAFNYLDVLVILGMGGVLAVVSRTPNLALITSIGLVLISRSLGGVIALLEGDKTLTSASDHFLNTFHFIRYILPDLSLLDIRPLTLYGINVSQSLPITAIMSISYTLLLLLLAVTLFNKRQFN